ncbi:probable flavin-containing monooxygenase 1 [Hibiscus syriacus]|uniref:probable flavin-containing monooxygenase 1 n=1 Tax=Hibiscus syriacus TaxID=106335 RepID=UPI0019228A2C|nr:probable flavin-containing monooxygenase 1 [Hibiscus syriacus]
MATACRDVVDVDASSKRRFNVFVLVLKRPKMTSFSRKTQGLQLCKAYAKHFEQGFSGVPNIPEFPPSKGPEAFHGKVIHSMDYAAMEDAKAVKFIKGKRVIVVGFQKSALDITMECSTANGMENPCTDLYRTTHWNLPDYLPWGFSLAHMYLTRFSELMVHKPGEALLLGLLATALAPLRWTCSKFVESDIRRKLRLAKNGTVPTHSFLHEICLVAKKTMEKEMQMKMRRKKREKIMGKF